ncbi:uncharacterized protein LOC129316417 [Prosopis cineraria]|uniref:uncharacterized protein LOC129297808 n=1 Tax=Prosopis cineraria TaxID=364024 RepID=UPI00240EFC7C|nr:uncharacterized protein LOC129297808 [Prosopis cineraria]XP_054816814.1 uncharacterized protein LOC129316417 [Prosopis cineraria]
MEHPKSFQCLILLISFIFSAYLTATQSSVIPRLSPIGDIPLHDTAALTADDPDTGDLKTFYYPQTLDHFNYRPESYTTFPQRYAINSKYWGGANSSAPIFAYFGAEGPIDGALNGSIGFLNDNAPSFKALIVYIEHRYYGKSVPFGSLEEAMKNAENRGYFSSAQAIADYAEIIRHIKYKQLNALKSPVIVIGGSYGGMLAAWFRLKYPQMALGALASSAPVLYFEKITPSDCYYSVVTGDFQEASESCYETILESWSEIDRVASEPDGLSILSERFNTCRPLRSPSELKDYLETMYTSAAQYNRPPSYPVTVICGGIDGASFGSDILSKIYAGVVAYEGNGTCKVNGPINSNVTADGWSWQTCSEMVIPLGRGNDTMFPPALFHIKSFMRDCKETYGVLPRPHWVTTYYGGHHIKLVLQRFGSNIIFSNGLRDPFSCGGVLDNISDSIVAITTVNGSHCLDILPAAAKPGDDPEWLVKQREEELQIIQGWLEQYYADLRPLKVY